MSIKDLKPIGDGCHYPSVTIMHDATGTPVVSPTSGAKTLTIPPGAVTFRVKMAGTVSFLLPDGTTNPGGVATLETTDGFVEFWLGGCAGNSDRWPMFIVLSAAANFMFDCLTPDGGEN